MNHILVIIFIILGTTVAESSLDQILVKLESTEFKERQDASTELLEWSTSHPSKALKEIPNMLRKTSHPEATARLKKIALKIYLSKTNSQFGFGFALSDQIFYEDLPVTGIHVSSIKEKGPAHKGGLRRGDIIVALSQGTFNRESTKDEVKQRFLATTPETKVKLTVLRDGKKIILNIRPKAAQLTEAQIKNRKADFAVWLSKELNQSAEN